MGCRDREGKKVIGGAEDHRVIESRLEFSGRIFKVYVENLELPTGQVVERELVRHPGAVGMVPVTREGEVVLVRQYRHPTGEDLLEIPAGKLDVSGETPEECAYRELEEEIGYRTDRLVKLAEFYNSPGYSDEYFYLYLAFDLKLSSTNPDADEFLEIERIDLNQSLELIYRGEIRDAKTIIGLLLARLYLDGTYPPGDGENRE